MDHMRISGTETSSVIKSDYTKVKGKVNKDKDNKGIGGI